MGHWQCTCRWRWGWGSWCSCRCRCSINSIVSLDAKVTSFRRRRFAIRLLFLSHLLVIPHSFLAVEATGAAIHNLPMYPPRRPIAVGSLRSALTPPRPIPLLPSSRPFSRQSTRPSHLSPTFFHPHSSTALTSTSKRPISFSFPPRAFADKHPYLSVGARLCLSTVVGLSVLVGAILAHDVFTYSERHVDRVPTNSLALKPRLGGKKNLPILEVNLEDEEDDVKRGMKGKPRLVIVGGGWGVSWVSPSLIVLLPLP